MSTWQVLDRKRLLVGDHFRAIGAESGSFEVLEEYQPFTAGLGFDNHRRPTVHGVVTAPKMLKVTNLGGGWNGWMCWETGIIYANANHDYPRGGTVAEQIELDVSNGPTKWSPSKQTGTTTWTD